MQQFIRRLLSVSPIEQLQFLYEARQLEMQNPQKTGIMGIGGTMYVWVGECA